MDTITQVVHPPTTDPEDFRHWLGRYRRVIVGAVLIVGSLFIAWLIVRRPEPIAAVPENNMVADKSGIQLAADAKQWQYIQLAVAKAEQPLPLLPAPGRVGFDEKWTANVGTPLPGRVDQVVVRVGDTVKKGDKLFSVHSAELADLDREIGAAREAVSLKHRVLDRTRELYALKAIPEKEVMNTETELKEAELSLKAALAKEQSLSISLSANNLFWVNAPRSGTVVELHVYESQEVSPEHETPLIRISNLDEVLVLVDVPEADAADIKPEMVAVVQTKAGDIKREGTVTHVSELVDPERQTVQIRIHVLNQDRAIRPNSFVEALFTGSSTAKRVIVDDDAVVSEGSRSLVFVARGSGRLEPVEVVLGRRNANQVEVKSGINVGDRYVAKGALLLLNQIELAEGT